MTKILKSKFTLIPFLIVLLISIFFLYTYYPITRDWIKLIASGVIGSGIGGFVVYRYVMHIESKKEITAKKENCTESLLSTQMSIIFQMAAARGIEDFIKEADELLKPYLNLSLKTLSITERAKELENFAINIEKNGDLKKLLTLTYGLLVPSIKNTIITLPYKTFQISLSRLSKRKINNQELACYMQSLVYCNKIHGQMIALITNYNENRIMTLNDASHDESFKYCILIACRADLSENLRRLIENYNKQTNKLLIQTANYIDAIGIARPISPERDQEEKPIFNEMT